MFFSHSLSLALFGSSVYTVVSPSPLHPSCGNATFAFRFCRRQAVPHLCIMSELKWRRCHLNTWRGTTHTLGRCLCLSAHFTQPASAPPPYLPSPQEQLSSVGSLSIVYIPPLTVAFSLPRATVTLPAFHPDGVRHCFQSRLTL